MRRSLDKPFLIITLILSFVGFFLFISASTSLLAREGARLSSVVFNQIVFGLLSGLLAMYLTSRLDYRFWKKYSFFFFLFTFFVSLLVFVPALGFSSGGARRWIQIGSLPSFQPVELLKLGFVVYFAAWVSNIRGKIKTFQYGLLPLIIIMALIALVLLRQPDTGSLVVIFVAGLSMFFTAGGRWKDMALSLLVASLLFSALAFSRPYIRDRILTFFHPEENTKSSSYQINQSLIAIGSGQFFGRGFGQSIQKFSYLPEPVSDSIFAVIAEEWGFFGSSILIVLFLAFALRGLKIASASKDVFGGLLGTGLVILITAQSFLNIASMLGVFPLTGMPLLFVSHGGTALFFALAEAGIVLNISKSGDI
ncbi:hypothetical protein COV42_01030 [Candidatus Campbellbacteria bacterium CG11_big_fil_rev_8_21_14_0_20_44_21]|uniref:Probable peptidoglycan glycosyltransferase FtsW n=1 Tax=Candidatus Campbellbacteria bacterium CG22_combo_CG10-13_8_21_14_all_43_18 TaxID=1974530 RepID=A0A2H0DX93_9BACT|nr:MAG: hypothetical protein COW82_00190 [Candidatus Campbellbacteria bacterium CG22_combo_CG10-13_8_21_14_all_43_18]PIR24378.1 MAG: hypothetical protein COV42_01030 [Candidatus Campbellbacteria bacterium CG11_big_fil_rev_8_21_14_0_20_44_21]